MVKVSWSGLISTRGMAAKWTTASGGAAGAPSAKSVHAEMRGQRVEGAATVGQVGDQRVDAGMVQRREVDVQDLVPAVHQVRHGMAAGLAAAAGEYDAHGVSSLPGGPRDRPPEP